MFATLSDISSHFKIARYYRKKRRNSVQSSGTPTSWLSGSMAWSAIRSWSCLVWPRVWVGGGWHRLSLGVQVVDGLRGGGCPWWLKRRRVSGPESRSWALRFLRIVRQREWASACTKESQQMSVSRQVISATHESFAALTTTSGLTCGRNGMIDRYLTQLLPLLSNTVQVQTLSKFLNTSLPGKYTSV